MVDPHHVVQFKDLRHSFCPPGISRLFVILPAVDRISPQLPGRRERVRRDSRDNSGISLFVKLEQFRMAPGVRAVEGNIDRDIPDDPDPFFMRVFLELLPLLFEQELKELVKADLLIQFAPVTVHCQLIPKADVFRPHGKHVSVKIFLYSAEKRVICKPGFIIPFEAVESFSFLVISGVRPLFRRSEAVRAVRVCLAKQRVAVSVDLLIVHCPRLFAKVKLFSGASVYISGLDQRLRIYKIRISRESRERLIGRLSVSGLPQRKDLRVSLARLRQKIHELICLFGKASDPVTGREARDRKQYTASSVHSFVLLNQNTVIKRLYFAKQAVFNKTTSAV